MFCRRLSGDEFGMFPEEPLVSAETDEDDPGEEIAGCKNMMNGGHLTNPRSVVREKFTVKDELIIFLTC